MVKITARCTLLISNFKTVETHQAKNYGVREELSKEKKKRLYFTLKNKTKVSQKVKEDRTRWLCRTKWKSIRKTESGTSPSKAENANRRVI